MSTVVIIAMIIILAGLVHRVFPSPVSEGETLFPDFFQGILFKTTAVIKILFNFKHI